MSFTNMRGRLACLTLAIALALAAPLGCAQKSGTGAIAGAGVGAIVGQAIGRNTAGTLIGTAIGVGVGYIIGDLLDKEEARKLESSGQAGQTAPLGGTKWKALSIRPEVKPPYESYVIEFQKDGWLISTQTYADGGSKGGKEHYRIKDDTLIINSPGYLVNLKFRLEGDKLYLDSKEFSAAFRKM